VPRRDSSRRWSGIDTSVDAARRGRAPRTIHCARLVSTILENVNLKRRLSREEYSQYLPSLQRRLFELEKACWDHKISSIIVVEGWDAAGKGGVIAALTQRLDPRGFKVYATPAPRTYEQGFPWLWRFWQKVPNRGEMVIFDQSWYGRVLEERVMQTIDKPAWRAAFRDIVDFERMLADDGTVILKFFLHIDKSIRRPRSVGSAKSRRTRWKHGASHGRIASGRANTINTWLRPKKCWS
jgi:polyphosphate kinase 2 (PPK2 family)